ncbi:MAG: hypothetical protein HYX80_02720 [Chloroflexi bacterium]|nr:hypothetical protein [Chloroflexota bacterium]
MTKKMTVVFHNEELYTDLKVEAARRHMAASDIVAEAVQQWLDEKEDEELIPLIEEARKEYEEKGGRPWSEVKRDLDEILAKRDNKVSTVAENKD